MNFPFKAFFTSNARLLLITALAGAFVYGYELMNFTLSIDEEALICEAETWFIKLGRFLLFLVEYYLFQQTVIPFVPTALAIILLAVAAVVISNLLEFKNCAAITFCVLFITFPSLFYQFQFSFQITSIALGILLAAISAQLFWGGVGTKPVNLLLLGAATILLGVALGAYQAIALFPPFIILLKMLDVQLKTRIFQIRIIGWLCLYMVMAVILYFCIASIFRWIYDLESSSYLTGLFGQRIDNLYNFVHDIIYTLKIHYEGENYYGERLFSFVLLPVTLIAVKAAFAKSWTLPDRFMAVATLGVLLVLPFTLEVLHGGLLPPRVQLCQGLAFAGFWGLGATIFQGRWVDRGLFLGVGGALLFSAVHCSRLFYTDYLTWEYDKAFATQLAYKISSETNLALNDPNIKLNLRGVYKIDIPARPPACNTFGHSFFAMNETYRITIFMRVNGIASFMQTAESDLTPAQKKAYDTMTVWPHAGCIRLVDGTVLVKLSEDAAQGS